MKQIFLIYLTDMSGGELNYSWVTKLQVKANTERGAVGKVARLTGLNFRKKYDEVYVSKSGATGLVIEYANEYPSYDYSSAEVI